MPELLLELFSEEIPARMQQEAARALLGSVEEALASVTHQSSFSKDRVYWGPRRLAVVGDIAAAAASVGHEYRGPKIGAPDQAIQGFLKKYGASPSELQQEKGYWLIRTMSARVEARELLARALPGVIRGLSWPKSMRWNGPFTWVRPLHRILCVLDGEVVPFSIEELPGIVSGDLTEGHRIMSPGAFAVRSFAEYERGLRERHVILDAGERMRVIEEGLAALARDKGISVVPDRGLLEEVAGLVEWPVPTLGRIDDAFMDLPPEVMRTTMRVNQRYFACVNADGSAAPYFGVVANIAATDGGATLVAGNERVLRARLSDARFFWDQDRKGKLEDFLPKLDGVVFHAKLGTQGQRVKRLERLARFLAPYVGADPDLAARAARLAKADLASGMVREFPELQGVMGRYYARHGGEDPRVAGAIGTQYRPLGPGDAAPSEPAAVAVALADKLDTLAGFFAADERPTGSGDPYALRRAALGVIRIVRENELRLPLRSSIEQASHLVRLDLQGSSAVAVGSGNLSGLGSKGYFDAAATDVLYFLADRLRVQLRAEGARHDVVAAAFTTGEDDLLRLLARADALKRLVESDTGANLLTAYKRAANILRIEDRKDGPHAGPLDPALLKAPEEQVLAVALDKAEPAASKALQEENYDAATSALAALREPLDAFFNHVTVNDPEQELRTNRLRLLTRLRTAMDAVADFSKIEG